MSDNSMMTEANDDPSNCNGQPLVPWYVALVGDMTTTGATILTGSTSVFFNNRAVARLNDQVSVCPVCHQMGRIAQGLASYQIDNGCQVAFGNFVVQCGCPWGSNKLVPNPQSDVHYLPASFQPVGESNDPNFDQVNEDITDGLELVNSALSFIPVIGTAFDVFNLIMDLGKGADAMDIGLDVIGFIPGLGDLADATKLAKSTVKIVKQGAKIADYSLKTIDGGKRVNDVLGDYS
jgi:uncharacterized Zn-binding protein involved in type VI secretion